MLEFAFPSAFLFQVWCERAFTFAQKYNIFVTRSKKSNAKEM